MEVHVEGIPVPDGSPLGSVASISGSVHGSVSLSSHMKIKAPKVKSDKKSKKGSKKEKQGSALAKCCWKICGPCAKRNARQVATDIVHSD